MAGSRRRDQEPQGPPGARPNAEEPPGEPIFIGSQTVTEADVEEPAAAEAPVETTRVFASIDERRESTRGLLAMALLGLLGVLVVAAPALVATGRLTASDIESLGQVILSPLVALVGSVIGFYFGAQAAGADEATRSRPAKVALTTEQKDKPRRGGKMR